MDTVGFLIEIFESVEIFLLILVRLLGFFIIMPIFTGANIPAIIRMAFAVAFAYMIFIADLYQEAPIFFNDDIIAFFWIGVTEFLLGFLMAYVVYIIFSLLYLVGQLLDSAVGFDMVNVLDPSATIQVPVIGNLLYLMAIVILIITGGLHLILGAVFGSFYHVPLGTVVFFGDATLFWHMISLIVSAFYFGIQLAAPVVGATLIINMAIGMLVKTVPQMNMFVVGIPMRLFMALIILFFVLPVFVTIYYTLFRDAHQGVWDIITFFAR